MQDADDNLLQQLNSELNRLQSTGQLQSKSTTKYDVLRHTLAEILGVESRLIYISTIDKAANSNARMQQMQIRTDVPWKLFVGVCLKDDVKTSKTYLSQTHRNLSMSTAPALEGSLWLFKDESDSAWKAVRGIFRPNSDIALTASAAWKQLKPEYINVKNSVPNIDVPSNSKGEAIDELKHLEVKAMLDALLQGPGQIILAGPPGTGKSHAARLLAAELVGSTGNVDDPNISFVQFHPTYEYEDFIEGFKPVLNSSGHFQLQQSPGLLMSLVNEMAEEPETARVLIVDEMNRANLSKVLGETLFLLEYRNTEITLKSGSSFSLPPNLLVISTMNTADRNIRSIDIALRRRFRYFELQPSEQALRAFFDAGHGVNLLGPLLFKGFTDLNQALTESLDRHHTIGHTFFMQPLLSPDTLSAAWQLQIGPLIEEYFFDQPDLANEFSFERFFGE